jgi:hypothetical protein
MISMPLTDINIYTLKQVRSKRRRYDFEGKRITSPLVCYTTLTIPRWIIYILSLRRR